MWPNDMNIWQFNALLMRRLAAWNVFNLIIGIKLSRSPDPMRRGIGIQAIGWAVVNFAIAFFGGTTAQKKVGRSDALEATVMDKEARNLRRLLWINAGLDVAYMFGGRWYAVRESQRPFRGGMGIGIIIQGIMLFIFDVSHALFVPGANR